MISIYCSLTMPLIDGYIHFNERYWCLNYYCQIPECRTLFHHFGQISYNLLRKILNCFTHTQYYLIYSNSSAIPTCLLYYFHFVPMKNLKYYHSDRSIGRVQKHKQTCCLDVEDEIESMIILFFLWHWEGTHPLSSLRICLILCLSPRCLVWHPHICISIFVRIPHNTAKCRNMHIYSPPLFYFNHLNKIPTIYNNGNVHTFILWVFFKW